MLRFHSTQSSILPPSFIPSLNPQIATFCPIVPFAKWWSFLSKHIITLCCCLGTLPGYSVQDLPPPENSVLRCEPDYTLCRNILPISPCVLSALRVRGEDIPVHLHPSLTHGVLPSPGGDYSSDLSLCSSAWQGNWDQVVVIKSFE